ncbi:asparagine synthetase B family protein [Arundinibacter roseus]|uniref:asparagine synthase (glutamine-hydrolyzing) n=1 Tax=Arundinibacter roseus TaxID=2070510 RepID=A0A4R4K394_9BACT|nr:asparagine synthase-related protein [Arundinibacter roseus]TDB61790.1 hypothetical protein EZE20_18770 [Arundinibacter roseus]
MSIAFGSIFPDQQLVEDSSLHAMYAGICQLPHERFSIQTEQNAGFGLAHTYATPESVFEQMPQILSEPQLLFMAQGRLDNRSELSRALDLRLHDQLTDGELIKQAYLRWGKSAPGRLLGDWSFMVYCFKTKSLFLARDQHGYTSLFYTHDSNRFAFSSSVKCLLTLPGFEKKLNEERFVRMLTLWPGGTLEHVYQGIFSVPPAHTLHFQDGKAIIERYWFPENTPLLRYKNTCDYTEELREILTQAIQDRLRSHKPVACMLSGGFDSGTVAYLTAQLMGQRHQRLTTFSHVPQFAGKSATDTTCMFADERPYMESTVRASGSIDPQFLTSMHISPLEGIDLALDCYEDVLHAASNAFWLMDINQTAAQKGFGTLLTGENGNGGISFTGIDYLLPVWNTTLLKKPLQTLKTSLLKPLFLKYYPSYFHQQPNSILSYARAGFLNKARTAEYRIVEDIEKKNRSFTPYYTTASAKQRDILMIGYNPRCQYGASESQYFGIEKRDPTGDVRVLNYCLSIPNSAFFDENRSNKQIVRQMMKDRLPAKILNETRTGQQSADIQQRVRKDRGRMTDLLEAFDKNEYVKHLIDTKALKNSWKQHLETDFRDSQLPTQTLLKTVYFASFLTRIHC